MRKNKEIDKKIKAIVVEKIESLEAEISTLKSKMFLESTNEFKYLVYNCGQHVASFMFLINAEEFAKKHGWSIFVLQRHADGSKTVSLLVDRGKSNDADNKNRKRKR